MMTYAYGSFPRCLGTDRLRADILVPYPTHEQRRAAIRRVSVNDLQGMKQKSCEWLGKGRVSWKTAIY